MRSVQGGSFPATPWSVLLQGEEDGSTARGAWEQLARAYWKPLYVFLRRRGQDHHSAADDIQGFFAHLLSQEFLRKIERGSGLFRSFLLVSLQRWRTDQHRAATARKRGGGSDPLPLHELEALGNLPPAEDERSPEDAFDRRWARTVYDNALADLEERLERRGRKEHFHKLRGLFTGHGTEPYQKIASDLDTTEGAIKQAALDLRREFGTVLREEVRRTVVGESQVDDEIRYLLSLLRS